MFILSNIRKLLIIICLFLTNPFSINAQEATTPFSATNNYFGNRSPLVSSKYIKLPVGAITPESWLKEYLHRQSEGLTGNLGKISAWLQKNDNAWLSSSGEGKWGWEEVPYWLKGYGNIGYILNDKAMIVETKIWIEGVLNSQREDGNFGPKGFSDDKQDFWANMIMLYCLQSYYEFSHDERVTKLMTRYFKFQLTVPDDKFLKGYWQKLRGGDNFYSVLWLYNHTGDKFLLDLAEKIHRNTSDWSSRGNKLENVLNQKSIREGMQWPSWYGDQIDWHNVNHAQCFREPAQYYLLNHDEKYLKASYENFSIIREHFGQVPGGMFGSDENARPGYADPRQGVETCGLVEQMNSDETMLRITGDLFWADHAENVAFNMYPAAVMPDFKSLHYITSPNMVLCDDKNHAPGISNEGPFLMMNPFSSRCCQHNHSQGWPYYVENLWLATPDNGAFAALYASSNAKILVGNGTEVGFTEQTNYPFEEKIQITLSMKKEVPFPLYLRIPGWCSNASVLVNDKPVKIKIESGKALCINRSWKNGDHVILNLPMTVKVKTWEKNHNSVSVNYGPLTFSLKIKENYIKKSSDKTAISDSKWQEGADVEKWPSWEIHPASDWNYGLIFDAKNPEKSFKIDKKAWPSNNFPFTINEVPIVLRVKAKQIPEWTLDNTLLCGELKDSPVASTQPEVEVELIPMGAARLRISAFPVIGNGKDAHSW